MEYTIVNGAGALARGVTKALSKNASKIKLLDTRVYRNGVYMLQKELEGVEFEKRQTVSAKSLEYELEGSDTVIYFTHDYLSMSHAKGALLEATAKSAKINGVSKLIWVCPIESDFYYTEEDLSPVDIKNASEEKAFALYPNLVMLHPNLMFGDYSYLIRYMTQSIIAGQIYKSIADPSDETIYFPIHFGDVAEVINHAIENYESVSGNIFSVKGKVGVTLSEMKSKIEEKIPNQKVSLGSISGIENFVFEYFRGISHDQNMCLMAEFFRENSWEFTHDNDYHQKNGLEHKFVSEQDKSLEEYTAKSHMFPLFSGYKSTELD